MVMGWNLAVSGDISAKSDEQSNHEMKNTIDMKEGHSITILSPALIKTLLKMKTTWQKEC